MPVKRSAHRSASRQLQKSPINKGSAAKRWVRSMDTSIEVFLCVGHIVAVVSLVVEHLF